MNRRLLLLSTDFCSDTIIKGFEDYGYVVDFFIYRPLSHFYMLPDLLFPNNKLLLKLKDNWSLKFYTKLISKFHDEYDLIFIIAPFKLPFYFLEGVRNKYVNSKRPKMTYCGD